MTTTPTLPFVSVIVPVHNGVDALRGCLAALAVQTYPADRYEVFVIDNNSTQDLRPAIPDDDRFVLLREQKPGSYAARNAGLASAKGSVLAFTDGDCVPDQRWLAAAIDELSREPRADLIGGAVKLSFAEGIPRSAPEVYEAVHAFPQERYIAEQRFAVTANMVTWRESFDRVGTFDSTLMSRGDADFGQRVAAAGGVLRFAPLAVVSHPARATWDELLTKARRVAKGKCDSERSRGAGAKSLLGLAFFQIRMIVRTCASVWFKPNVTGFDKLRYLLAYVRVRAACARVMTGAAIRAGRGKSLSTDASTRDERSRVA